MTVDEIVFRLKLHGWCVLEGVIPEDKVDGVRQSIEAMAPHQGRSQTDEDYGTTPSDQSRRPSIDVSSTSVAIRNLISVNQSFAPYLADGRILGAARALFGPYVRLRSGKGLVEYPGTKRGTLHADGPFNQGPKVRVFAPYQDAVMQLTSVWMLTPFSRENGGTILVPGSHRSETNATGGLKVQTPYPGETQATGPAGSVVLFDSRLWHTNGTNNSDKPRVGMVMLYFPWWLNQEAAMPPGTEERARLIEETGLSDAELGGGTALVPEHVYRALPEDVKPLLRHWVRP